MLTAPLTLADLLTHARKRRVQQLLLHQFVLTCAAGLACATLILLVGSELVGWGWLPTVVVITLGVAAWIARKKFPSTYQVAQTIDTRLHLADSLSTAAHFAKSTDVEPAVRDAQHAQAEQLAQSVDLKQAMPMARPRALYPAIALAAAVAGLFMVRYAVQGSFDPRQPLVQNAIDNFFSGPKEVAKNGPAEDGNQPGDQSQDKAESKNADFAGDEKYDPTMPDPTAQPTADAKEKSDEKGKEDGQSGKGNPEKGENQQADNNQKQDGNQGDQDAKGNQDPSQDKSVMDKVREAVNDLLNKMKQGNDSAKNQKGEQQNDGEKQPGQDGQSQDKNQGDGTDAQKASQQSSEGENGKNAAQKKQSNEPQQGVGSQDGDKNTKQAEALKAMGKISELLGKRAENVKGSVTMEVGQTRQQLKTVESARSAQHAEAGSEIHRDQVPPAYEQYVQQYFEQVRKSSSTKPTPPQTPPQ